MANNTYNLIINNNINFNLTNISKDYNYWFNSYFSQLKDFNNKKNFKQIFLFIRLWVNFISIQRFVIKYE